MTPDLPNPPVPADAWKPADMTTTPDLPSLPAVLFDGHAVMQAMNPQAWRRTSAENVSDVLDAVVKLLRAETTVESHALGARSTAAQPAGAKLTPDQVVAIADSHAHGDWVDNYLNLIRDVCDAALAAASGDSAPTSEPVQGDSIGAPRPEPEAADEDRGPAPPRVTGSPNEIWLNYGDIEDDCTHDECYHAGGVTWCQDKVFDSDVRYVLAPPAASQQADREAE